MQEETIRDKTNLMKRIEEVISSESWENEANVPDFILAEFLFCCFNAFNNTVKKRDKWCSVHLEPCNSHFEKTEDALLKEESTKSIPNKKSDANGYLYPLLLLDRIVLRMELLSEKHGFDAEFFSEYRDSKQFVVANQHT